jgi:hypothetical protein
LSPSPCWSWRWSSLGGKQGTIVVERIAFSATTVHDGKTTHPPPYLLTSIDETSADGKEQQPKTVFTQHNTISGKHSG